MENEVVTIEETKPDRIEIHVNHGVMILGLTVTLEEAKELQKVLDQFLQNR